MNPVAFNLFGLQIRFYSLFILLGVTISYFIIKKEFVKEQINEEVLFNMFFLTIIFGIIGARFYYVIFNFSYYKNHILEIIQIYNGGLAIHGGIIAGLITLKVYTKKYNIDFFKTTDIIAPCLILSQGIGRWGNFFNSEAYGTKTTLHHLQNLHIPNFVIKGMHIDGSYYTPTFFYESILCIIGFIILLLCKKYFNKKGITTGLYLIIYGLIRFFIESYRLDSLMIFNFKAAQIVSIVMLFIGLIIIIKFSKTKNVSGDLQSLKRAS